MNSTFCKHCGEGVTTFCRAKLVPVATCPKQLQYVSTSPFPVVNGERTTASLELIKQALIKRSVNKSLSFQKFHDILPDLDKFEEGDF